MRLLLITNDFPHRADPTQGVFNLHLARSLAEKHEVRVIVPRSWVQMLNARWAAKPLPPEWHPEVELGRIQAYYPTYYYPPKLFRNRYGWFLMRSLRGTIRRLLRSYSPDVVVGYWAHPDGEVAVRLARAIGVPGVVVIGGSDVLLLPQDPARRRRIEQVLRDAHAIVVVSSHLNEKIIEFGIDPAKIHVWHQGVDKQVFVPGDRGQARQRLGIPVEGRKLLWVGRMVPVKGLEVLLRACAKLRGRRVDFHLYLVGDGALRKALEAQVASLGLADHVTFAGALIQEKIADWYRAADLTVLSSHSEGLPNVLRESLACGTPFVATRVGGIAELGNGQASRLVPAGDDSAMADAIEQVFARSVTLGQGPASSPNWNESAESFVRIVSPLVSASQDPDQPWWIDSSQFSSASPEAPAKARRWRQFLRNGLGSALMPGLVTIRGPSHSGSVCLTFDDGPHPRHTPCLLDALRRHGIRATFFVVGRLVEQYPDLVRRIHREGHVIGNHSFYHSRPRSTSAAQLLEGVRKTNELLLKILGKEPTLYRPPHGKLSLLSLIRLWQAAQKIVLWNVDPKDYACSSPGDLLNWFQERPLRSGDLVLLHDRLPYAASIVPNLVARARDDGLDFVTADQWAS